MSNELAIKIKAILDIPESDINKRVSDIEKLINQSGSRPKVKFDVEFAQEQQLQKLERFMAQYSAYKGNPALVKQVDEIRGAIDNINTSANNKSVNLMMGRLNTDTIVANRNFKNFSDQIDSTFNRLGAYFSMTAVIMGTIYNIKKAVNELKEMDTALTNLSKVTNITREDFKQLGLEALKFASQYGRSVKDALDAQITFARAGYKNYQQTAELSLIAQSAGQLTEAMASKYLVAANAAFGYGGSIEKLNVLLDSQNQVKIIAC